MDFGSDKNAEGCFGYQRAVQSSGPPVNAEFYPGSFDAWSAPHKTLSANDTAKALDAILKVPGSSVNVYMMHGGTNFGFGAGAQNVPFR